jgi:hypothetical protein
MPAFCSGDPRASPYGYAEQVRWVKPPRRTGSACLLVCLPRSQQAGALSDCTTQERKKGGGGGEISGMFSIHPDNRIMSAEETCVQPPRLGETEEAVLAAWERESQRFLTSPRARVRAMIPTSYREFSWVRGSMVRLLSGHEHRVATAEEIEDVRRAIRLGGFLVFLQEDGMEPLILHHCIADLVRRRPLQPGNGEAQGVTAPGSASPLSDMAGTKESGQGDSHEGTATQVEGVGQTAALPPGSVARSLCGRAWGTIRARLARLWVRTKRLFFVLAGVP